MPVQFQEGLIGDGLTRLLLGTHVDSRQQMMLHALYLAVRHGLELTQGTEVEDPAKVVLLFESCYVGIGRIMQVRRAYQPMRTDRPTTRRRYATQIAGVVYMFEDDFQFSILNS